jgi:hypothetical protein
LRVPGSPTSRTTGNDVLASHGALALFGVGIALIVLAACFSTRDAVAPIFAFTGFSAVVLAAFLHRLHGDVEVSLNKIKLALSDAKAAVGSSTLTPEQLSNVYEQFLEAIGAIASGKSPSALSQIEPPSPRGRLPAPTLSRDEAEADDSAETPIDEHPPAVAVRGFSLEGHVRRWLEQNGWKVEIGVAGQDAGWDFDAKRANERAMVQVRARARFGAADIAAVAVMLDAFLLDVPHAVLVLEGTLSEFAVEQAFAAQDVMTTYIHEASGHFRVIAGKDVIQRRRGLL